VTTYPTGAFFVVPITGPAGWWIALGQTLAGRPSAYQHAGMIVTPDGGTIEAQPEGARPGHVTDYSGRLLRICDGPVQSWAAANPGADVAAKRAEIAADADGLRGIGYAWLDYLALALLHLHLPSTWVRQRVQRSGRLICSQLVSAVYRRAGIDLFPADHLSGDCMPADLADYADRWEETRRDLAAA
jgi:hypothetical protein